VMSQIDFNWWGSMSHLVKLTHRDYFDCTFVENGWVSQQVYSRAAGDASGSADHPIQQMAGGGSE